MDCDCFRIRNNGIYCQGSGQRRGSGRDAQTRAPAGRPSASQPLDETSKQIIEQLQEDGRRPYAAIGKAVGLSEAAVRQRVQRLLDNGVMQIVAVTDRCRWGSPGRR